MTKPSIVPLTTELYIRFDNQRPPTTVKGLAVVDDENVLGIVCKGMMVGVWFVFCDIANGAPKKSIIKAWRQFAPLLQDGREYFAIMDDDLSTAPAFIRHFGFEQYDDTIYRYRG